MKNFRTILLTSMALCVAPALFAQNSVNPSNGVGGWGLIAAAFVLGVAAAGGALGQGRAIAAACEGIARNPGAAGPIRLALIIGLALIESLVIYCLIIAFIAVSK